MRKIVIVAIFVIACELVHAKDYIRVCYYTNWAQYRPGEGKFLPEDIDPFLCTHVIYAFAKIDLGNRLAMVEWNDEEMYNRTIDLKKKNPKLKVLLSVGGWNHENGAKSKFSKMVNNRDNRATFVKSCLQLLRKWGFDGLDVNWEFPAGRGNSPKQDKQKFTILLQELLIIFLEDANAHRPRLLLTAAVSANHKTVAAGYEVEKLGKLVDWINLMTYDLHGHWEKITGHHTAMMPDGAEQTDERKKLTVPYGLDYWIKNNFPPNKIALGLATYGRTFRLKYDYRNGLGAPKADWQDPKKGQFTRESGFLSYYEICKGGFTTVSDNIVGAPYGYKGYDWVGFDNPVSMRMKVVTIKGNGLAGAMIWSLALDDFSGHFCGKGKYPLIKAVVEELKTKTPPIPPTPTEPPKTTKKAEEKTPPIPTPQKKTKPPTKGCRGFGLHKNNDRKHSWCKINCAMGYCPESECRCSEYDRVDCFSVLTWRDAAQKERNDDWCETNCAMGNCPQSHCKCS